MITGATYITFFRIVLIIPIAMCIITQHMVAAGIMVALAAVSDFLDGYIARTYHQTSELGAFLDPLADKLLILTIFGTLWFYAYDIPTWFIIVVALKECLLGIGALLFFLCTRTSLHARRSGKIAMVLYVGYSLLLCVSQYTYIIMPCALVSYINIITPISVAFVTVYALCDYGITVHTYLHR